MDADLTDETAYKFGAQVIEARPVASGHRHSDGISYDLAEDRDLGGSALDGLRRDLMRHEH